jgi:hypothetical protein
MSKTIYCSFCGNSNHEAGMMMEGSDRHVPGQIIRICRECAKMAIEVIARVERGQNPE